VSYKLTQILKHTYLLIFACGYLNKLSSYLDITSNLEISKTINLQHTPSLHYQPVLLSHYRAKSIVSTAYCYTTTFNILSHFILRVTTNEQLRSQWNSQHLIPSFLFFV